MNIMSVGAATKDEVSSSRTTSKSAEEVLFAKFLEQATAEMPTQELKDQVAQGLRRRYVKPPIQVIEQVLRRPCSDEKARQIMFFPGPEEAALYPLLLAPAPDGSPEDHTASKSQILFLGPVYLAHRKSWDFVRSFILAGGLKALVNMFEHKNLHLRGQAIEVFRDLTGEEVFPWHDAKKLFPSSHDHQNIMQKMFELTKVGIIPKLIANYDSPFPNASYLCLCIFAFYASWLRVNFCKSSVLQLSQILLDRLLNWSNRQDVSQDERELAKRLHEDFSRFGPAGKPPPNDAGVGANANGESSSVTDAFEEDDFLMYEVKEDRTMVNHEERSQAEEWKEKGNAAYKEGDWSRAIEYYSRAMDVPVTQEQLLTEGPRRAIFHSNRAAAYLARSKDDKAYTDGDDADDATNTDTLGHLEGADFANVSAEERKKLNCKAALMDCDQALDLESGNMKARYRKAQALQGLGKLSDAIEAAVSALNIAPKHMEKELKVFLDKLKQKEEGKKKKKSESESEGEAVQTKMASVKLIDPSGTKATSGDNILDSILGGTASNESRWPSDERLNNNNNPTEQEEPSSKKEEQEQQQQKKGPLIQVISSTEH